MVDLDRRIGAGLERIAHDLVGDPPSTLELATALEERGHRAGRGASPRRRHSRVLVAALAVLTVVAGALVLTAGGEDDPAVHAGLPGDGDAESLIFGFGPGWHDLDPGPLPAGVPVASVWTGTELVVLVHPSPVDGGPVVAAAYDPVRRSWRELAAPPFDRRVDRAVWADDRLVVLFEGGPADDSFRVAALHPEDEVPGRWSVGPPTSVFDLFPSADGDLVWTGELVVAPDLLVAWAPDATSWERLPAPPGLDTELGPGIWQSAWTGDRLVLVGEGQPTLSWVPGHDAWTVGPVAPKRDALGESDATAVGGSVVLVEPDDDLAALYDVTTQTWTTFPDQSWDGGGICAEQVEALDDRRVAVLCGQLDLLDVRDGTWTRAGTGGELGCCLPLLETAEGAVFVWESDDDTTNNARAPFTSLRIYVPEPDG